MNYVVIIFFIAFIIALILSISTIIYLEYVKLRDKEKYNELIGVIMWNNLPSIVFAYIVLLPFIKLYELYVKRGEINE